RSFCEREFVLHSAVDRAGVHINRSFGRKRDLDVARTRAEGKLISFARVTAVANHTFGARKVDLRADHVVGREVPRDGSGLDGAVASITQAGASLHATGH